MLLLDFPTRMYAIVKHDMHEAYKLGNLTHTTTIATNETLGITCPRRANQES